MWINWDEVEEREPVAGFRGRFVHTDGMTIVMWNASAGAELPLHDHPHEMVVNVLEGELELTVDGETRSVRPGEIVVIPGGVPHQARAVTDCRILDAFHPVREDYR